MPDSHWYDNIKGSLEIIPAAPLKPANCMFNVLHCKQLQA